MIDVIIAACGGAFVAGAFGLIQSWLGRRAQKSDMTDAAIADLRAGLRVVLYDRIKHLSKKYIAEGEVSADALEDLISMHTIFHDNLDGDGLLDALMETVKGLRIK